MRHYIVHNPNESIFERIKKDAEVKILNAFEWIKENKEVVILMVPVAVSGLRLVTTVAKSTARNINLKKEESVKNLYCYDPSLGHYWKLKRELTNDEWIRIDKKRKTGQRLSEILDELKVLK